MRMYIRIQAKMHFLWSLHLFNRGVASFFNSNELDLEAQNI